MKHHKSEITTLKCPRQRGLSLVEMLVSLAITAMLLTATMVAIDASFHAYAVAAESASTQTSTRLVTHRLMRLVRTSTAHAPVLPDATQGVNKLDGNGKTLTSPYLTVLAPDGDKITVAWNAMSQWLTMTREPAGGGTAVTQPILGGVSACMFTINRRRDNEGLWVVERASIDFTVHPDDDASLAIEAGNTPPLRVIASTKPRRLW